MTSRRRAVGTQPPFLQVRASPALQSLTVEQRQNTALPAEGSGLPEDQGDAGDQKGWHPGGPAQNTPDAATTGSHTESC